MSVWGWLAAGVLTQWAFIVCLRASRGLTRPWPAAGALLLVAVSVGCVAVALNRGMTLAVGYGIWTGAGVVLAAATGVVVFGDRLGRVQWAGLGLVVVGVVVLQIASQA